MLQRPDRFIPSDQIRWRERQQAPGQLLDDGVARRRRALSNRRVARVAVELERTGQRTHGIEMGTSSLTALEGADGVNGEPRNRCQFLLREPCGFAKPFQLRAERSRIANFQDL